MGAESDQTGRIGVAAVQLLIVRELGWKFREQYVSDFGIDAHVEVVVNGRPTGRLVALQIKSGPSCFTEGNPGLGWVLRGPKRHLTYWLEYQCPVLVVLYDAENSRASWVHVNSTTGRFTPRGYRIDVPATQVLGSFSKRRLEKIAERWIPHRGSRRSRARDAIARCLDDDIPVQPSNQLWDLFSGVESVERPSESVLTYNIPLDGDAPAVALARAAGRSAVKFPVGALRGSWRAPAGTAIFVCENPVVVEAAVVRLGAECRPLVCLAGLPNLAAAYLLLGLGFCGARIKVHTDHDRFGRRISETLFHKTIDYEEWCPNSVADHRYEEQCLSRMLKDLRS